MSTGRQMARAAFLASALRQEKKTAPRDQEVMADGTGNNALADESKCVEYGAVNWFSLCTAHTHPS